MTATLPLPLSLLERRLGAEEGSLDGADKARAEDALVDATANALAEVPTTTATAWETSLPDVVRGVILKAARREYENPEGYRVQGLGEFSATVATASGVSLTEDEKATVRRAAGLNAKGHRVYTTRMPSAYSEPDS